MCLFFFFFYFELCFQSTLLVWSKLPPFVCWNNLQSSESTPTPFFQYRKVKDNKTSSPNKMQNVMVLWEWFELMVSDLLLTQLIIHLSFYIWSTVYHQKMNEGLGFSLVKPGGKKGELIVLQTIFLQIVF